MSEGNHLVAVRRWQSIKDGEKWVIDEDSAYILNEQAQGRAVVVLSVKPAIIDTGIIRLKVVWEGGAVWELENDLRELLEKYNLECYAQGYNYNALQRDMTFTPIVDEAE